MSMKGLAPPPLNDELRELVYLLLVKSSTLRVIPGLNGEPCPEGELQISTMLGRRVDGDALYGCADNSSYIDNLKGVKLRDYEEDVREYFYKVCKARGCFPQDYYYIDAFVQIDIYCRNEDNFGVDEADYVRKMFKKIYKENGLILNKFKLFLFDFSDIRDYTGYSMVAPDGFSRVAFDIYFIIGILSED